MKMTNKITLVVGVLAFLTLFIILMLVIPDAPLYNDEKCSSNYEEQERFRTSISTGDDYEDHHLWLEKRIFDYRGDCELDEFIKKHENNVSRMIEWLELNVRYGNGNRSIRYHWKPHELLRHKVGVCGDVSVFLAKIFERTGHHYFIINFPGRDHEGIVYKHGDEGWIYVDTFDTFPLSNFDVSTSRVFKF